MNKINFCSFIYFKYNAYFASMTAIISWFMQVGSADFGISKPFFAIRNCEIQRDSEGNCSMFDAGAAQPNGRAVRQKEGRPRNCVPQRMMQPDQAG
jgi:hypothetical protein